MVTGLPSGSLGIVFGSLVGGLRLGWPSKGHNRSMRVSGHPSSRRGVQNLHACVFRYDEEALEEADASGTTSENGQGSHRRKLQSGYSGTQDAQDVDTAVQLSAVEKGWILVVPSQSVSPSSLAWLKGSTASSAWSVLVILRLCFA